jgi:hypothetical protein
MSAALKINREAEILEVTRVKGYAPILPAMKVLDDCYNGIEKEITEHKKALEKLSQSFSRLTHPQALSRLRNKVRKLQTIQMEIDTLRTMA